MPIIAIEQLQSEYKRILLSRGMTEERATQLADSFVEMGNEGVYSHGINRFPVFIAQVDNGDVQLNAEPECVAKMGALEQWDCHLGPGVLNAHICADRAMELAKEYGIGMVGMRNTNHWMRGGTYVLKMARQGFAGIGATNTIAVMPPWGGKECRIGNNPLVMAVAGDPPALVDCSMSQFSYGQIQNHILAEKELPVYGGYDDDDHLTKDPNVIWENRRTLPMGYWKGSSLSIVLDMLITAVSGGLSVPQVTEDKQAEFGVSQFLIAIDLSKTMNSHRLVEEMRRIRDYVMSSEPAEEGDIRIGGSNIQSYLEKHARQGGIDIHPDIWEKITAL